MSSINISALELKQKLQSNEDFCILDVRTEEEWKEQKIHDNRIFFLPFQNLSNSLDSIPKTKPLYVLCRSGLRSLIATQYLRKQGFDAKNIDGGLITLL